MIDLRARVREVLEQGHLMSLGTIDDNGPWVADLVYVFDDDFNIYWASSQNTRHSQAIAENSDAAGTITVSNKTKEKNFCIQFSGKAVEIVGKRPDLAVRHLMKREQPALAEGEDFIKEGQSWYVLTPTNIELIDEENFGFKRQRVA